MDPSRLFLAVICSAVLAIALLFVGPSAQAHPGHAHARETLAAPLPAQTLAEAAAPDVEAIASDKLSPSPRIQSDEALTGFAIATAASRPSPTKTCAGACCGASACCVTGLPIEPDAGAAPHLSALRAREPVNLALPGIGPGRLSEPPRSVA